MAQDINRQIEQRIQAFAQEINQLVRQAALEAVQEALGGPGGTPRAVAEAKATKAARGARRRSAGGRRSAREMNDMMEAVQAFVASHPGARMEQISEGVGRSTVELRLPVNKLLEEGRIRKQGEKRATEYFPANGGGQAKRRTAKKSARKKASPKRKTR